MLPDQLTGIGHVVLPYRHHAAVHVGIADQLLNTADDDGHARDLNELLRERAAHPRAGPPGQYGGDYHTVILSFVKYNNKVKS